MTPTQEFIATLVVLAGELLLIWLCIWKQKQPVNLAKPRLFPYSLAMLFLAVAVLVTTAHTVSVVTGKRLEAKNKMRGQQQQSGRY